jgi:hypothetical protein
MESRALGGSLRPDYRRLFVDYSVNIRADTIRADAGTAEHSGTPA